MSRVPHLPYLEKRPSGYFFRRRLPPVVRGGEIFRGSALVISLRSNLSVDARQRTHALTALCDLCFALMRDRKMQHLTSEQAALLTELARFEIAAFEATRAAAPPRSEVAANQAAACERAAQATLRRALALGDREIVRDPLTHVAARLGVSLDETDPTWPALAHEAIRVMLDVSQERERREVGLYEGQTVFFRSALARARGGPLDEPAALSVGAAARTLQAPAMHVQVLATAARTAAITAVAPVPAPAPRADAAQPQPAMPEEAQTQSPTNPSQAVRSAAIDAPSDPRKLPAGLLASTSLANVDLSDATALDKIARAARTASRPPKILIDVSLLSLESREALKKTRGMTFFEAFRLYIELKLLGYGDDFDKKQKRYPNKGAGWKTSSLRNAEMARDIWADLLGADRPFEDIAFTEVEDALTVLLSLPADHGKSPKLTAADGYRDLVERVDEMEQSAVAEKLKLLKKAGTPTEAEKESAHLDSLIPRLRVHTFLRHGRFPNRVGKMLLAMQLIDENPFEICCWSNEEVADMKAHEEDRARTVWDDRIYDLFRSPVFQGQTKEPGDPLFWAPLIARFQGLREEECLQLRPDDFGSEEGIAYFRVRNCDGNRVKSTAGERKLPVHPALIELGFLKLVELRRKQGQPRLFPHLKRGETKSSFTELFTKAFGYYRRANDCYWRGLDFHAFRTSFHSDLLNDDGSDAIRRRLMGHEPLDTGEKAYSQGLKMATLLKRLRSIEIDTSMIVSPFAPEAMTVTKKAAERGIRVVKG